MLCCHSLFGFLATLNLQQRWVLTVAELSRSNRLVQSDRLEVTIVLDGSVSECVWQGADRERPLRRRRGAPQERDDEADFWQFDLAEDRDNADNPDNGADDYDSGDENHDNGEDAEDSLIKWRW